MWQIISLLIPKNPKYYDSIIYLFFRLFGYSKKNSAFLVSQAKWETGNYKSSLFLRANNLFGMRPASKRKYSRKENITNNYADYYNIIQSAYDRYLYDKDFNFNKNSNITLYIWNENLKEQGYYTASKIEYLAGLSSYLPTIETTIKKSIFNLMLYYFIVFIILLTIIKLFFK
jgi:hypothetical protein